MKWKEILVKKDMVIYREIMRRVFINSSYKIFPTAITYAKNPIDSEVIFRLHFGGVRNDMIIKIPVTSMEMAVWEKEAGKILNEKFKCIDLAYEMMSL